MKGKPLWALGCMSGTSLDGVDAALVRTDGREVLELGRTAYRPYTKAERTVLREALGKWPGEAGLEEAEEVLLVAHTEVIQRFKDVDLVGFHGQTLAHDPAGLGTHQLGDGALLSTLVGLPVIWDFRSTDVQMGGQGAPLAPYYHHAAARYAGLEAPVCVLNLGGVGNLTWCDPRLDRPDAPGAVMAFDTGPANAPINDLMTARAGKPYDEGGSLAAKGAVNEDVVNRFLGLSYFLKMPPKSLDRDDFHQLLEWVSDLSDADAAATLTACAAAAVEAGLAHVPERPDRLLVSGGGRQNPTLMRMLKKRTGLKVKPVEAIGLDGDMVEAQAFAYLAVRVLNGLPTSGPETTGVAAHIGGGRMNDRTYAALEVKGD